MRRTSHAVLRIRDVYPGSEFFHHGSRFQNLSIFLNQRRSSVFSEPQESPEKIRDGDNMNNSFKIQFEDSELQQEQFICSSCLSAHHEMEQSFCIFCGWKVLA
jgi:hypothetical protein